MRNYIRLVFSVLVILLTPFSSYAQSGELPNLREEDVFYGLNFYRTIDEVKESSIIINEDEWLNDSIDSDVIGSCTIFDRTCQIFVDLPERQGYLTTLNVFIPLDYDEAVDKCEQVIDEIELKWGPHKRDGFTNVYFYMIEREGDYNTIIQNKGDDRYYRVWAKSGNTLTLFVYREYEGISLMITAKGKP